MNKKEMNVGDDDVNDDAPSAQEIIVPTKHFVKHVVRRLDDALRSVFVNLYYDLGTFLSSSEVCFFILWQSLPFCL